MAGRKFAQIRPDMWLDDEWRALTMPAQHLYMTVLTDPGLSYAGVTDWKPGRLRQRAAEWALTDLLTAAAELSYAYFLVFDEETEEVMVRSFLRHDGLLKQPRMAVSMASAFGEIGSNKIRAAVVWELTRLRKENPDWDAWEKPQVKTVLRQQGVNPREMVVDLAMPLDIGLPIGFGQSQGNVSVPPTTTPAPTPTPSPISKEIAVEQTESYPHQASELQVRAS